jgi:hypothetical protein
MKYKVHRFEVKKDNLHLQLEQFLSTLDVEVISDKATDNAASTGVPPSARIFIPASIHFRLIAAVIR